MSDIVQLLSLRDPSPWRSIIGFKPDVVEREARTANYADLLLSTGAQKALVEIKLGHVMDEKQQRNYEDLAQEYALHFVALTADEYRVVFDSSHWSFTSLGSLLRTWTSSADDFARLLAGNVAHVVDDWDEKIHFVFEPHGSHTGRPLSILDKKFLARVASRRVAKELRERERDVDASVTSGRGGLPLVAAWSPVRGDNSNRTFIAEVRWTESPAVGELRFGVDYFPNVGDAEDEEIRRAAYDKAQSMNNTIMFTAIKNFFDRESPALANLLYRRNRSRPKVSGDWEKVIKFGFAGASRISGRSLSRRNTKPGFYGDEALRFQAIANIDFSKATAFDLINLIDSTLTYLNRNEPTI